MMIRELIHIPVIAAIVLSVSYLWNLKVRNRAFRSRSIWLLGFFGSLFNVWGLDALHREFGIDLLSDMILLSTSAWLVFAVSTNAKYYTVYGWSQRDFWLDYGGDFITFNLAGILIFAVT